MRHRPAQRNLPPWDEQPRLTQAGKARHVRSQEHCERQIPDPEHSCVDRVEQRWAEQLSIQRQRVTSDYCVRVRD